MQSSSLHVWGDGRMYFVLPAFFRWCVVWCGDGPNFYPTLSLLVVPLFTMRRTRSTGVYWHWLLAAPLQSHHSSFFFFQSSGNNIQKRESERIHSLHHHRQQRFNDDHYENIHHSVGSGKSVRVYFCWTKHTNDVYAANPPSFHTFMRFAQHSRRNRLLLCFRSTACLSFLFVAARKRASDHSKPRDDLLSQHLSDVCLLQPMTTSFTFLVCLDYFFEWFFFAFVNVVVGEWRIRNRGEWMDRKSALLHNLNRQLELHLTFNNHRNKLNRT